MIRSELAHLPVHAGTHAGMSGKNNEDRFAVTAYRLGEPANTNSLLAVLSDGIGGHRAGEIAAEIAVNEITQRVGASDGIQPQAILNDAIVAASQEVFRQSRQDADRLGMGGTCAVAWVVGRRLYTASVGDSRIHLIRQHAIRQVSMDHTWVQEALQYGFIQPAEAKNHPNAHVIRRYLGSPTPPEVDFRMYLTGSESNEQALANQGMLLQPGDRVLLCSDGLSDLVETEEILQAFEQQPAEQVVNGLIDLANQRGGYDNITIVTFEVPAPALLVAKKGGLRPHWVRVLALAILALLLIIFALGWLWMKNPGDGSGILGRIFGGGATVEATSLPTKDSGAKLFPSVTASPTVPLFTPADLAGTQTAAVTATRPPTRTARPTLTRAPTQSQTPIELIAATPTPK